MVALHFSPEQQQELPVRVSVDLGVKQEVSFLPGRIRESLHNSIRLRLRVGAPVDEDIVDVAPKVVARCSERVKEPPPFGIEEIAAGLLVCDDRESGLRVGVAVVEKGTVVNLALL